MTFDEITDLYDQEVVKWLVRNNYTKVSEHVIMIIRNILMAKDGILVNYGSFVAGVLENDLSKVMRYADDECMANLKLIYQGFYNIDTYYLLPKDTRSEVSL
jgi:succinate dehydrogenase flavin-adding protein (antitoxin of CptAB toxin-antitoxin module)